MYFSEEEFLTYANNQEAESPWGILGIRIVAANQERVVATMPVTARHRQPMGYLHGGMSLVLAESVASIASVFHIDPTKKLVFGLEINANHLRPKRDGILTATALPVHLGRTTHVWDVRIMDERDKLICISRCTTAIVEKTSETEV